MSITKEDIESGDYVMTKDDNGTVYQTILEAREFLNTINDNLYNITGVRSRDFEMYLDDLEEAMRIMDRLEEVEDD